ncbi:MAG: cupin domain-containing protein [Dehalococcoidia bacterium]
MTDRSDTIENPVTGERITFRKRARDSNGALLEFELAMEPRGVTMPAHVHPRQEEHVEVTAGQVRLRLGGTEHVLNVGEAMTLPAGIPHMLWNDGDQEARALIQAKPGLRTETAIETLFGLARDGKTNKSGMPNPLQGVLLAREYETFLPSPPIPIQRVLLAALAPVARLFGYRTSYPQYSGSAED